MTDNRGRRHTEKAGSITTHGSTHRRPAESFKGAPDGDKGREGERTRHGSQSAHRRQNGTSHGDGETERDTRQAGREDKRKGGERDADGLAPGE